MWFRSRRQTLPAMTLEGPLGPNDRLDEARAFGVEEPDALCVGMDGRLLFSSGNQILALGRWGETPQVWARFDHPVTALCGSQGGRVAAGLADATLAVLDPSGKALDGWRVPPGVASIVDCLFLGEDEIVIVDNGYRAGDRVLAIAPWDETASGQVLSLRRTAQAQSLAVALHCPSGISADREGNLLVTLLERASIVDLTGKTLRPGFPAYLGRIRRTEGGFLLACPSRRDPLIEFLKTEQDFVAEMKAKIAPQHWISPRGIAEFSHDFPIELGATRLFGEIKPWAPSFSYGLLLELDESYLPVRSSHCRAHGRRHAISDALVWDGDLIAVSRASGEVLNLGRREHN